MSETMGFKNRQQGSVLLFVEDDKNSMVQSQRSQDFAGACKMLRFSCYDVIIEY